MEREGGYRGLGQAVVGEAGGLYSKHQLLRNVKVS